MKNYLNGKTLTNIASVIAALVVLISYVLSVCGFDTINMSIALQVGAFIKMPFIGVDVSMAGKNLRGKNNVNDLEQD